MCCEPARTRSSRYGSARALWRVIALTALLWLALSAEARASVLVLHAARIMMPRQ